MTKRVFVAGAPGRIGRSIIPPLHGTGYIINGPDRTTKGQKELTAPGANHGSSGACNIAGPEGAVVIEKAISDFRCHYHFFFAKYN